MAQERLAMQKIKDLLRLHLAGGVTSRRQLAQIVGCSPGGHFKIPHPWPGQNPPPDGGGHGMITR